MNLYAALRSHFPPLDDIAIETADAAPGSHPGAAIGPLHYTWADLEHGSARMAGLFADLALPAGARVLVHVDKSVEAVMLYLAVLRCGLVHVPINTAYQAAELTHFIENAQPDVVICAPRNFKWISTLAFATGVRWVFTLGDDRTGSLLERATRFDDRFETRPVPDDALAAIIYTSGTTGRSKGAQLTHGNLLANAEVLHREWAWREGEERDVLVHALPLFHVHGLFVALHGALRAGARTIWFHRFDPAATLERLREASVFMGVPTLYVRLLAQPGLTNTACARMRLFVSGSAPLLPDTFAAWHERTGHTILERYGMSETVMLTSNPYRPESARRPGTVGRALPGVGVRIHDSEARACAPGEIGGIEVTGPSVFSGYWRMPEKTAEEFTADGWFRTGDMGTMDDSGVVAIVGRSKDLIISGGFNVYPAEIEGRINELAGIAESAVVGVPHPDFGEAVVAVVVPREGVRQSAEEIQKKLKATIAGFKVPKHVRIVDALPRNAMGKVEKKKLREELAGLFQATPSTKD